MDSAKCSHANRVLGTAKSILTEAMSARRRYAADLSQYSIDEDAFATAVDAFDAEYRHEWSLLPPEYRDEATHLDAQFAALQEFLYVYLREAGRSEPAWIRGACALTDGED